MALQNTTPTSKSQKRAARLLNVEVGATYDATRDNLLAAGVAGDGLPSGHDWRSAGKLDDATLVSLLRGQAADRQDAMVNSRPDRY